MNKTPSEASFSAECLLSPVEAVVAGTLALMTAMARGCCEEHRALVRGKVIANLAELARHPRVSQQFRAMASHLQQHWHALECGAGSTSIEGGHLWHKPAETLQ